MRSKSFQSFSAAAATSPTPTATTSAVSAPTATTSAATTPTATTSAAATPTMSPPIVTTPTVTVSTGAEVGQFQLFSFRSWESCFKRKIFDVKMLTLWIFSETL